MHVEVIMGAELGDGGKGRLVHRKEKRNQTRGTHNGGPRRSPPLLVQE